MRWRRPTSNLLEAALQYAASDVPVFPCHYPVSSPSARPGRWATAECSCDQVGCAHPSEHPLTPFGLEEATTDPGQVLAWWHRWPHANIGLATGVRFDVLELADVAVLAALRHWAASHGVRLTGPAVQTGRGGWHYLFAPTGAGSLLAVPRLEGGPIRNVYWRGQGGYVIAPPSRHVTGGVHRWVRGLDTPLPEAPGFLRRLLALPAQPAAAAVDQ